MPRNGLLGLAGLATLGSMVFGWAGCSSSSCEDTRTCGGSSHDGGGGQSGDSSVGGDAGAAGDAAGSGGQPDAAGTFSLSIDKSSLELTQGSNVGLGVSVTRTGTASAIDVSLVGAPSGVTATPITLQPTDNGASFVIAASGSATQGLANVIVRGTSGGEQHDATLSVLVKGPPGTLDQSFGTSGVLDLGWTLGFPPIGPVVASDGAVYVAGTHRLTDDAPAEVVHVPLSGTPDASFGGSGKAPFPAPADGYARSVNDLVLDTQGRLLLAGTRSQWNPSPVGPFASIGRMTGTGAMDSAFGTAGEVGGGTGQVFRALLQSSGKLLVAGRQESTPDLFVHSLDANGGNDPSYGTAGSTTIPTNGAYTLMAGLVPTASGGCRVIYGFGGAAGGTTDVDIAELDASGNPTSFGSSGIATVDAGGEDTPFAVVALPSGGFFVAGAQYPNGFIALVANNGTLDASFGVGGVVKTNDGFVVQGLARDAQGNVIAAGPTSTGWRVARYGSDGVPDPSFGNAGAFDSTSSFVPSGLALLPDGRIAVAGSTKVPNGPSFDFAAGLARLWP